MEQMIVISAIGTDSGTVIEDLTQVILDCGGNIRESRVAAMGAATSILLLVAGNWHTMNRLERDLRKHADSTGLSMQCQRTDNKSLGRELLPYAVDVVGLDQPGIINHLCRFFGARKVEIGDVTSRTYAATNTGTPMFSVQMLIHVPATLHLSGLREEFMEYCDQLNVDAIMEPVKHP
jgi:glycine cleavage system transcriptional repressor